jgi:hypothetical protein
MAFDLVPAKTLAPGDYVQNPFSLKWEFVQSITTGFVAADPALPYAYVVTDKSSFLVDGNREIASSLNPPMQVNNYQELIEYLQS